MNQTISMVIAVVVLLNILGCFWLLWWTRRKAQSKHGPSQIEPSQIEPSQHDQTTAQSGADDAAIASTAARLGVKPNDVDTTGHVWDEDLMEYNHPLPKWWLNLFYLTIVFALIYLVLYPGIGNFRGTLGWSSDAQHQMQAAAQKARYAASFAPYKTMAFADIAIDPKAQQLASNLFANQCAACHGADARGAKGFPNLVDADWLYGGDPETLVATISDGRQGVMPGWKDALGGDAGVDAVASYVLSLSMPAPPTENAGSDTALSAKIATGQQYFQNFCVACHGAEGKGTPALGAPNLTDHTWLYGKDLASLRETIANGRNGAMPAHAAILSAEQIRVLAAWLSQNAARTSSSANGSMPP